eukprot:9721504-Karenia_brevis.AAC.1
MSYAARHSKRAWIRGIQSDLNFLSQHARPFKSMAGAPLSEWRKFFMHDERIVKKAFLKALLSPECNTREFLTPSRCHQSLRVHMYKKHGWLPDLHRHVDGTSCPVCLTEFWDRARVLEH